MQRRTNLTVGQILFVSKSNGFVSKSFPLSPRFNCFLKSIMGRHGLQSILYLSGFLLELDQVKWEKCSHSHNSSVFIFAACICPFVTWPSELRRRFTDTKLFFEALSERNSWTDAIYDKSTKRRNHVLWKCGLSCLWCSFMWYMIYVVIICNVIIYVIYDICGLNV